jgi:pyridoxal 5'-phosphate synthase pdxT subunit
MKVGILGFQGDFEEHAKILLQIGVEYLYVKYPDQLERIDALILPGGESTHFARILTKYELGEALKDFKKPILGTCAGIILLAKEIEGGFPGFSLERLDITVSRNAYGRQRESFEDDVFVEFDGEKALIRGAFIRAPRITRVGKVDVVAKLRDGEVVGVKSGNVIGLTFHPEIMGETFLHEKLLKLI